MARKPRTSTPTSVILSAEQKSYLQGVAKNEERTYSSLLRWIVTSWIDFHRKKERRDHGQEGKEAQKGG